MLMLPLSCILAEPRLWTSPMRISLLSEYLDEGISLGERMIIIGAMELVLIRLEW